MKLFNFGKKETRNEVPYPKHEENACTEVQQGVGLLQKLLSLQGYGPLHQSAFFAAVNLISNSVAQMSWHLKSYDDKETDGSFLRNIIYNSDLTQFMLVKNLIKDCIMHGNAFCYVHRDNKGNPISLEYLPFGQCNIVYNQITKILLYQVPSISKKFVEPINLIHIRMLTDDGINGKSILSYADTTLKLSGAAEKSAQSFFNSGCTVQGILSTDSPRLTKEQRQSIRQAWGESQLGQGTGISVLEAGMKYTPVSSNSKDSQLLESRLYSVQEIARFFNISPTLLGDLSKTSYNTLEASQQAFVLNALMPYVDMLEQELNEKLLSPAQKQSYYIDIYEQDIIKADKQSQVNYLTTLVNAGIITRNEARIELGFSPMEGADELTVSFTDVSQNKINQDKNNENKENEEQ